MKKEETLISGYIYHVINSICIHEGPNIYIYKREEYKKPGEIQ
jgi:hypothetical protein